MTDKEHKRLSQEKWRSSNREHYREYGRQYSKTYYQSMKNSEEFRRKNIEWNRQYRKTHHDFIRQNQRNSYKILRSKVLDLLGNRCVNPYSLPHFDWNNDPQLLQVDHVNGGGCKEYRDHIDSKGYLRSIYHKILAGESGYQLLCPNCNWLKRIKNKEIGESV